MFRILHYRREIHMGKYAFGVDIGGTTVKLGLFDGEGNLLEKWEITTRKEDKGAHILPDVAASIEAVMRKRKIHKSEVIGVGAGSPGLVLADGTVQSAVNLGWDKMNIPQTLGGLLELPVKAGNDANIAAYGELWQGGGKGYRNMVMITLGTGVGGGVIIDGKILVGASGAGGEMGHMIINTAETDVCGCGRKGCLEQYASATGIARLAKRRLSADQKPSLLRGEEYVSAKKVFDAVKQGDEVAIEIAEEFGMYLGDGLAKTASVVDPEVFVIGGGVSKAGEILFDYIRPAYEKCAFRSYLDAELKLAKLGNDAGIYGAAGLFLMED